MLSYLRQKGFLLLSAIIIIIAIAFIAATASYLFTVNSRTSANEQLTTQAFFVAQGGLEVGVNRVIGNDVAQRLKCSDLTGEPSVTNIAFGTGEFTVTADRISPVETNLTDAINASDTVIRIISNTGYAAIGTVFIEDEIIDYGGIGTTLGQCTSTPPCLIGAVRGAAGTTAVAHTAGTAVNQDFCQITSTGYVPTQANALASRTVQRNTIKSGFPIWAGGSISGISEGLFQWNGSGWDEHTPAVALANVTLRGTHINSPSNGWMVGDRTGTSDCGGSNRSMFILYDGDDWTRFCATGGVNSDLYDVHCASESFCVAVGENRTFAHWNGTTWSPASVDTGGSDAVDNVRFRDVFCLSSTECWAVGDRRSGDGSIAFWNGTQWKGYSDAGKDDIPNDHLMGVTCVATDDCWLVGNDKVFMHYDEGTNEWSNNGIGAGGAPSLDANSVTCVATDDCWAVGDRTAGKGSYWRWNDGTSTWDLQSGAIVASIENQHIWDMFCVSSNECYSVGNSGASGEWNGSTWSDVGVGLPSSAIRAVHGVQGGIAESRASGWNEIFN